MNVTVTIDSVDRTNWIANAHISKVGSIENVELKTVDSSTPGAATWRPTLGDPYRITVDGTLIAGGTIDEVREYLDINASGPAVTHQECVGRGWEHVPSTIHVDYFAVPAQTVLESYDDVCTTFLVPRGITNIGSTSGGDSFDAMEWRDVTVADILDQLQTMSGMPHRINGDQQFAAGPVGTWIGTSLNASNALLRGLSAGRQRTLAINRAYGSMSIEAPTTSVETKVGDGTATVYPLNVRPNANVAITVVEGSNTHNVPDGTWTYDDNTRTLTRSAALANSASAVVSFEVGPSVTIRHWHPSVLDASGDFDPAKVIDGTIDIAGQTNIGQASEFIRTSLLRRVTHPQQIEVSTLDVDYWPWMRVNVDFPSLAINTEDCLVQSVDISILSARHAEARMSLLVGDDADPDLWTRQFRNYSGAGSAGGVTVIGGGGSGGGGGAGIVRIPVGGSAYRRMPGGGGWRDVPYAKPLMAGGPAWSGTYTLRAPVYTTASNTSIEVRLHSGTGGTAGATTTSNSTSWDVKTAPLTFPTDNEHVYLLQSRVVGDGAVCGDAVLER